MFQAIAIHYAKPEHVDEFVDFMHRVIAKVGDAPGLIEFTGFRAAQGSTLWGFSRWESAEDFQNALPLISSLSAERREEWSEKPDDLFLGVPI